MSDYLVHRRGARFYAGSEDEIAAELRYCHPFKAKEACKCGSSERIWSLERRVFCRRCGREHQAPPQKRLPV
jgi:hypothetical protein